MEITQKNYSQAKTEEISHIIVMRCEMIQNRLISITKKNKRNFRRNNFYHYFSSLDKCCKSFFMIFTNSELRDELLIRAEVVYEDQNEIIILDRMIVSLDEILSLLNNLNEMSAEVISEQLAEKLYYWIREIIKMQMQLSIFDITAQYDNLEIININNQKLNKLNNDVSALKIQLNDENHEINSSIKSARIDVEKLDESVGKLISNYAVVKQEQASIYVEIKKSKVDIEEIENSKKTIIDANQEIEKQIETYEKSNERIKQILGAVTADKLYSTFEKRAEELGKSEQYWLLIAVVSLVTLLVFLYAYLFNTLPSEKDSQFFYMKNAIFSTSGVVWILYCFTQRNKERLLREEYSFKASVALTVDAYKKLLIEPTAQDKLILDTLMNEIYKTPIKHKDLSKTEANFVMEGMKIILENSRDHISSKKSKNSGEN